MKQYAAAIGLFAIILLVALVFASGGQSVDSTSQVFYPAGSAGGGGGGSTMAIAQAPGASSVAGGASVNYSRLEISPSYAQVLVKPGESGTATVTVRNRGDEPVTIRPFVSSLPVPGPYAVDESWIGINPGTAEIPAGGSVKVTITATIPASAYRGSYSTQIVMTDEQYPSLNPMPVPSYLYQMSLGVNVVAPPAIRIGTPYISDQLRAGQVSHYQVSLENTGRTGLRLDPKISADGYGGYDPTGTGEPALKESDIAISAPSSLAPGATGNLEITVTVPPESSGYYNGYIDLGIDDPSVQAGEGRISLNFNTWKQPAGPFIRNFTLEKAGLISIELTSGIPYMNPLTAAFTASREKEPAFDVHLTGPGGAVPAVQVRKVMRATVSLGSQGVGDARAATYQETGLQYFITYAAEGTPGEWQLSVMPGNTPTFDYRITLGEPEPESDAAAGTAGGMVPAIAVPVPAPVQMIGTG